LTTHGTKIKLIAHILGLKEGDFHYRFATRKEDIQKQIKKTDTFIII